MFIDEIKSLIYSVLLSPSSRICWLYLLIYASVGLFISYRASGYNRSGSRLWTLLFPAAIYNHASFRMDLKLWMISLLITRLGAFGLLAVLVHYLSTTMTSWATIWLPEYGLTSDPVTVSDRLLFTLVTIVVFDLGYFAAHHLSHKVPLLWSFHQVHHAAEHLTPITASRFHPVDHLFTTFVGTLMSSLTVSAFTLYHGTEIETVTVLNVSIVYFLFLLSANFRHSHIWIGYGPFISRILVSPCMHQVHHSIEQRHVNRNYGFIFSFWDGIFRCRYIPQQPECYAMGLTNKRLASDQSVFIHLLAPFADAYQQARKLAPKRREERHAAPTKDSDLSTQADESRDP